MPLAFVCVSIVQLHKFYDDHVSLQVNKILLKYVGQYNCHKSVHVRSQSLQSLVNQSSQCLVPRNQLGNCLVPWDQPSYALIISSYSKLNTSSSACVTVTSTDKPNIQFTVNRIDSYEAANEKNRIKRVVPPK